MSDTTPTTARWPKVRFRARVSIRGMLTGALGGLGVAILMQQFAIAYPTRTLVLACIIGGAYAHLLVANVGRAMHVQRLNARLAAAYRGIAQSATLDDNGAAQ